MKKIKLLTGIASTLLITSPLMTLSSCGQSVDFDKVIENLTNEVISEFKEYSKHPHASYYLEEIRSYLTNKVTAWGYQVMRDQYGNIWFDIPATAGKENLPKLILQAHMDMVMRGIPESQYPYTGVDLVENTVDGRKVLQSRDNLTSIGADDGIGVATILAIAKNTDIAHGPLRAILTADEEEGLYGAEALSTTAIDADYLLNIDGEGTKEHEYIVTRGCAGLAEYHYNKKYNASTAGLTGYEIEISGFAGGHYNGETNIIYDENGPQLKANADRYLLEVLNELIGKDYTVQISDFNHKADVGGEDEAFEARHLPTHARVSFTTSASQDNVNEAILTVYKRFEQQYTGEDWSKIQMPTCKTPTTAITKVMSDEDTKKLVKLWAECNISVEHWEGTTEEEKIKYNYPTKSTNISMFTIKDGEDNTKQFSLMTRGVSGTNEYATEITDFFTKDCLSIFDSEEISLKKDYGPWDAGDKTKLIELACEGFRKYGTEPYLERTRGGVEPACFSKRRPGLEQACIGPRIEGVHFPGETLYVDTIPLMLKSAVYVLENIDKIAK